MVEGDSGAGESVLYSLGDARGVAVGGDGNGATVVHANEGGTDVLSDGVWLGALGNMAVFYVPPDRNLRRRVLCLRRVRTSAHLIRSSRTIGSFYTEFV